MLTSDFGLWVGVQCRSDAQKAEEYGSHDKTFEISEAGEMTVTCAGMVINTISLSLLVANLHDCVLNLRKGGYTSV